MNKLGNYSWDFKKSENGVNVQFYHTDRESKEKLLIAEKVVISSEAAEEFILDAIAEHRGLIMLQQAKMYPIEFNAVCVDKPNTYGENETVVEYAEIGIRKADGFSGIIDRKSKSGQYWHHDYVLNDQKVEEGTSQAGEAKVDATYPGLIRKCEINRLYYINVEDNQQWTAKLTLKEIPSFERPGESVSNTNVTVFRSVNSIQPLDEDIVEAISIGMQEHSSKRSTMPTI